MSTTHGKKIKPQQIFRNDFKKGNNINLRKFHKKSTPNNLKQKCLLKFNQNRENKFLPKFSNFLVEMQENLGSHPKFCLPPLNLGKSKLGKDMKKVFPHISFDGLP